ncbi:MAG: glycerophosphodiester phosphodiesterase [Spirochaetales bacterium]|nr:glycerophosphodiester phosphodiesterase [Spirochaetales bacterium]
MERLRIIIGVLIIALAGVMLYLRLSGRPGDALQLRQNSGFSRDMTIIAHRGASHLAPEETIPAYLLARDMGADYLEIDVQRTSDGDLIGLHDDSLERTTNATTVFPGREKEPASEFTTKELLTLDAGSWFNQAYPKRARETYKDLRIIRFSEFLQIAAEGEAKPGIYIETKSPERHPGIEEDIVEALKEEGWLDRKVKVGPAVIFQSFDVNSLRRFKEIAPEVPRVLLISQKMEAEKGWTPLLEEARPLIQAIGPVGYLMWPWNTGKAHRMGLIVHAYTLNSGWQMRLADWFSVDGFFTDRADQALIKFRQAEINSAAILQLHGY